MKICSKGAEPDSLPAESILENRCIAEFSKYNQRTFLALSVPAKQVLSRVCCLILLDSIVIGASESSPAISEASSVAH